MKTALIHSIPVTGAHRFGWTWYAEDGAATCAQTFTYYYDCCQDARRKGYECRFDGSRSGNALPKAQRVQSGPPAARRKQAA